MWCFRRERHLNLRARALLLSSLVGCGMAAGCGDSTGPTSASFAGTYVLVSVLGQALPTPYPPMVDRLVVADTLYLSPEIAFGEHHVVREVMVTEDPGGTRTAIERAGTWVLQPAGYYGTPQKLQPNDWINMDFSEPCHDPEFCFGMPSPWGKVQMQGMLDGDRFLAGGSPELSAPYMNYMVYRRLP